MARVLYNQPFQTPVQLVKLLRKEGLQIHGPSAKRILEQTNFHRFKAYLHPYRIYPAKTFQPGSRFRDGLALYYFDEELRSAVFEMIAYIEVAIRTRLDHFVTQHLNDPFWYLSAANFTEPMVKTIKKFKASFGQVKDEFCDYYKRTYFNPHPAHRNLPPFWIIAELTTFGDLRFLLGALDKTPFNIPHTRDNVLDRMSVALGARNLAELNSWMTALRDVRNKCGHHARLFNANLRTPSGTAHMVRIRPAKTNRLYHSLVMMVHIGKHIGCPMDMKRIMQRLFRRYPQAEALKASMGFPANWETDPFWP